LEGAAWEETAAGRLNVVDKAQAKANPHQRAYEALGAGGYLLAVCSTGFGNRSR